MMTAPLITLLTDFGRRDPYVGIMEGVMAGICPDARFIHLSHDLPAQDVTAARFWLERSYSYFQSGCVHLAVVDPTVGTERRALAVAAHGQLFVAPDNGLVAGIAAADPNATVVALDRARLMKAPAGVGYTFHGRDVFAPAAASLACGEPLQALGKPVAAGELAELGGRARAPKSMPAGLEKLQPARLASLVIADHFGNLITDLSCSPAAQPEVHVPVRGTWRRLPWYRTYGEAFVGELMALRGSFGTVEVAVRNGSAQEETGLEPGDRILVSC